jgi:ParB/RepB/Spo0J family partition protein
MKVENIKLTSIKTSTLNHRRTFDEGKMKDLVASVKEKGIIEPIIVRTIGVPGAEVKGFEIVCGERRFRAAKEAGLEEIPAVVRILDDRQALEFQVIENLQREDVHPLEEAEGYERLLKLHVEKKLMTIDDLAVKVGKSLSYVRGRMKLLELIPENRKFFYDGKFSPSVALIVSRVPQHLQKEAGAKVAKGQWAGDGPMTSKKAQEYIHEHFMLQLKEAQFDTKEKGLAGKMACLECPKRTGNQKDLFPDVSGADTCTDPTCFKTKKDAFTQRALDKLRKQGKTVLSVEESKKMFQYEGDDTPDGKYIGLSDSIWKGSKRVMIKEIAKASKDVDIVYAVQPFTGKIIEMVDRKELPRMFKAAGIKSEEGADRAKNLSKAKVDNRVTETKQLFWREKLKGIKDRRCLNVMLLFIALREMSYGDDEQFLEGVIKDGEWNAEKLYALGDEKVKELLDKAAVRRLQQMDVDDEDLEFLCGKIGFSVAKDYVITEAYLQAMMKDELAKLDRELGIGGEEKSGWKKSALVAFILKHAPKGKVPKEISK